MNRNAIVLLIAVTCCTNAWAQQGWHIELDRTTLTPAHPTVTIRLSAGYPTQGYIAFAAALLALHATEPGWSNPVVLLPPPSNPGVISGPSITGITGGQIHFPPNFPANPANPIPFYEVQWTATEFSRRDIEFRTQTTRYEGYPHFPMGTYNLLGWLHESRREVRIVPAPATVCVLAFAVAAVARRRRSSAPDVRPLRRISESR